MDCVWCLAQSFIPGKRNGWLGKTVQLHCSCPISSVWNLTLILRRGREWHGSELHFHTENITLSCRLEWRIHISWLPAWIMDKNPADVSTVLLWSTSVLYPRFQLVLEHRVPHMPQPAGEPPLQSWMNLCLQCTFTGILSDITQESHQSCTTR